jgi:antitoxin component YwqK of YwqJK toxin-antitoxin module
MKSVYSILLSALLSISAYGQKTDTTYFDLDWKASTKEKSSYYRITKTMGSGKGYDVEDYFNSGKIQMKGTYTSLSPEVRSGTFTWYYENGNKQTETVYEYNVLKSTQHWDEAGNIDNKKFEKQPTFPGGMGNFYKYISENFRYPKELNPRPKGIIRISFVVNTDGSISDVYASGTVDPYLDAEAVRVVQKSPKWEPGIQDGRVVRVKYTVPISMK